MQRYARRPNQLAADIEVIDSFRHITLIFRHMDGPRWVEIPASNH